MEANTSANAPEFLSCSNKNRRLISRSECLISQLIENQNLSKYRTKQIENFRKLKTRSILFFVLFSIAVIFFNIHIYIYNRLLYGPFHLNREQFIEHVKSYKNGQSWFRKIEYIQVELGENATQGSSGQYNAIRKYSGPETQYKHVATFKKVISPSIYIKSPTPSQQSFHTRFPFIFESFSQTTLECIIKILLSNEGSNKIILGKSNHLTYIKEQYSKNATLFNKLVLLRCGILIGYLYRPKSEMAFIRNAAYHFHDNDIAFDITRPYCSLFLLIICSIIFMCLFIDWLLYLYFYASLAIRLKLYKIFSFLSFPIEFRADTIEKLRLLNINGTPQEQLLYLDKLISLTHHKLENKIFIVKNDFNQLFVVMIREILSDESSNVNDELSPFIVCPVNDIRIVHGYGIYYGNDSTLIPWPFNLLMTDNYAEWLHSTLMEISNSYKNRYEDRVMHANETYQIEDNSPMSLDYLVSTSNSNRARRRRAQFATVIDSNELRKLVVEEVNFQRFKRERQRIFEAIFNPSIPASPQFIARFRLEQKAKNCSIDSRMANENIACVICLEEFKLNDSYWQWPCTSPIPHIFHPDCMLNTLRMKNTCPVCRHAI